MTRLDRYKQKLTEMEEKQRKLYNAGRLAEFHRMESQLQEIRRLIKEAEDYYAPKPIKELLTQEQIEQLEVIPLTLECFLAADYLTDCACTLSERLSDAGLEIRSIVPELEEIRKRAETFASILCTYDETVSSLLLNNDTLVSALHKKTRSYIAQRFNPEKKKE